MEFSASQQPGHDFALDLTVEEMATITAALLVPPDTKESRKTCGELGTSIMEAAAELVRQKYRNREN